MSTVRGVIVFVLLLGSSQARTQQLPSGSDTVPESERQALLQLFNTTNGHQWVDRTGWAGPAGTECEWFGVICGYSSDGRPTVHGLFLGENGLTGTLPESLADLANLSELLLYRNRLTGSVPKALLQRFDEGYLRFLGYAGQFSPIVEVDLNVRPSGVICGDYEIKLVVDGPDTLSRKVCRNATQRDRATFWEHSSGDVGVYAGDLDRIARLIETLDFAKLAGSYSRNVTHGTFEAVIVIYRDGTKKTVVDYAESAPAPVWLIKRAIAGVVFNAVWEKTKRSSIRIE